jgi:FtsP/CotA-like multicopper oxidase with cupredoxin domain
MPHVVVPPGGRAEFVVTGLKLPTLLRTRCYESGAGGDRDPQAVLAAISSQDSDAGGAAPNDAPEPPEKAASIAAPPARLRRTIVLTEDADGFYIDGRAFRMNAPAAVVVRAGTVEEWTLRNKTDEVHDIHIHQVHFLVESIGGKSVYPRLWRDTVLVPVQTRDGVKTTPGIARILVDFRNPAIRGTFVFHCHMLDHEDGGMMAKIKAI